MLTSLRMELDRSPAAFGELRPANELLPDGAALQARMREDGYLFLRRYLDRDLVMAARQEVVEKFDAAGALDRAHPVSEAVALPGKHPGFGHGNFTKHLTGLPELLYAGRMMEFFERFLGGPVRHYDHTWFRGIPGGASGTYPHCDIVYMGRGTFQLYTAWTPIGDTPMELGGLMILEGSHRQSDRLKNYLARDVDAYCTNAPDAGEIEAGTKLWQDWDGRLSSNPVSLREKFGGRWLTTNYEMGDVLIFTMATVHASLDNQTNRYRFSTDSRYQLASEPIDERWIGANPIGHGPAGKRGKIC